MASQSNTPCFVAIGTVFFSTTSASRLTSFFAIVCVIGNRFSTAITIIAVSDCGRFVSCNNAFPPSRIFAASVPCLRAAFRFRFCALLGIRLAPERISDWLYPSPCVLVDPVRSGDGWQTENKKNSHFSGGVCGIRVACFRRTRDCFPTLLLPQPHHTPPVPSGSPRESR